MSASVWKPDSEVVNVNAESSNISQVFTATAAQTSFTLTNFTYTPGTNSLAVFRNGQRLIAGLDWTETSSTQFSLLISVDAGELIEAVGVIGSASEAAAAAQATLAEMQAVIAEAGNNFPLVSFLEFLSTGATPAERRLSWNDTDGTLDLVLKGGAVTLQIGQEELVRVKNITGSAFSDGQAVYISGSAGQRLTAALAKADAAATSDSTIAVITEPIAAGAEGFATRGGLVRNLNTSAFAEGDTLYLSAATAGAITNVKPVSPNLQIRLGWVVRSHSSQGIIFVSVHQETSAVGARGNGGDAVFWENDKVVTADYTITSNKNAMTAGPVTVNNGVTVTVPSGSVWTIV